MLRRLHDVRAVRKPDAAMTPWSGLGLLLLLCGERPATRRGLSSLDDALLRAGRGVVAGRVDPALFAFGHLRAIPRSGKGAGRQRQCKTQDSRSRETGSSGKGPHGVLLLHDAGRDLIAPSTGAKHERLSVQ